MGNWRAWAAATVIAAGMPTLALTRRPRDLATQQAAASVGQGQLLVGVGGGRHREDRRLGEPVAR